MKDGIPMHIYREEKRIRVGNRVRIEFADQGPPLVGHVIHEPDGRNGPADSWWVVTDDGKTVYVQMFQTMSKLADDAS